MTISSVGSGASALSALSSLFQGSGPSAASALSPADRKAMTSAVADIASSLTGGGTSPASLKSTVESAIDGEVKSGKLTDKQAAKLKSLFDKALSQAQDGTTSTASTDGATGLVSGLRGAFDGLTSAVSELRDAVKSGGLYGAEGSPVGRVGALLVDKLA
jgi:hypothetical protein